MALGIRPDRPLRSAAAVEHDLTGGAPRTHAEPDLGCLRRLPPAFPESSTDSFAATQVRDRSGRSGRFAGQQLETRLRYWIVPDAMLLDTGVDYLIKGRFLRDAPNAPDTADTFFGYLNATFFF